MELHIAADASALSRAAADWITTYIIERLSEQDRFTLVLSGGSTPQQLHKLLAASPYKEKIDWKKLHIFWGDERYVPFTDRRNNAKMAYDTLLNFVDVPAEQIHVMRTDIGPEASADAYAALLKEYFPAEDDAYSFDLVLLGMGDDGHTLSLFPGTHTMHIEDKLTTAYFLQQQDMYRITLTAPIVNRAAAVAFLVSGEGKAKALKEVIDGDYHPDLYPSQVIQPAGELHWFIDNAAAALLD